MFVEDKDKDILYVCGRNGCGQLGNGNTTDQTNRISFNKEKIRFFAGERFSNERAEANEGIENEMISKMKGHLKGMIIQKDLKQKIEKIEEIETAKKENKVVVFSPIFRFIIGDPNIEINTIQKIFLSVDGDSVSRELSSYFISHLIDLKKVKFFSHFFFLIIYFYFYF